MDNMFGIDEFEVDSFLDQVFEIENEVLSKETERSVRQLPECNSTNDSGTESAQSSTYARNFNENCNFSFSPNEVNKKKIEDGHLKCSFLKHDNTSNRNILCGDKNTPSPSNIKRQRKFPGPAGLLPERNHSSFNMSSDGLESDTYSVKLAKDVLRSQSTLSDYELEDEPWQNFLSDLGAHQEILKVLNISSIKKKAAARLLVKRKVPFLAAVLHHADSSAPDPSVILRDVTGEIHGTLHREVWDKFGDELKPGCLLILQNVGVLSTGISSRRHYLNITSNNLIALYTLPQGKVQYSGVVSVQNLNFTNFTEDWKSCVHPILTPSSVQFPSNAVSLLSTSLHQLSRSPEVKSTGPTFFKSKNSSQIGKLNNMNSFANFSQSKNISGNFAPSKNNLQTRENIFNTPQTKNVGLNFKLNSSGILSPKKEKCHYSSVKQPTKLQEISQISTVSSYVNNKTSINYPHFPSHNNNLKSQDLFLSCDSNFHSTQIPYKMDCDTKEKVCENSLGLVIQPKRSQICTNNKVQDVNVGLLKESNSDENIFRFSNPYRPSSQNKQLELCTDTRHSVTIFSQDLRDDEKSIVENVLDGFDSEAFFDDF